MQIEETKVRVRGRGSFKDYLEVIKPRETSLLVFIGIISALVSSNGLVSTGKMVMVLVTLLIASAGANGLTNYLDRSVDTRMKRTLRRALPSQRIFPPERALIFTAFLTTSGLILAWFLHPYVFLADLVGTTSAIVYRKKVTCVFPQGMIASCTPVIMGWFAVTGSLDWELGLLCALISLWLPSHIWSVMMAHREDYRQAGITYFPINCRVKVVSRWLLLFCLMLYVTSIGLYFIGHFGWLYLVVANISGIMIVFAGYRMLRSEAAEDAWRLYKISAFPYLGVIFLAIGLDLWIRLA